MTQPASPPVVRHARLTRSQIRARLSPAARVILAAISYLLKAGEEKPLSHRTIARQARVGAASVSRLMPVLAAERGNIAGNDIPFVRRRQAADGTYLITLLAAPEIRGWYQHEPGVESSPTGASFTPPEAPVILADQLDFLGVLALPERSIMDHPIETEVCSTPTPETTPKTRSILDHPHPLSIHDHKLASSEPVAIASSEQPHTAKPQPQQTRTTEDPGEPARTPPPSSAPPPPVDPRVVELAGRGIYAGLARRVLAARPDLTLAEFERLTGIVARRGRAPKSPAVVVASILARGEQVDEGMPANYVAGGGAGSVPPPAPAERVSDLEIATARIDPRDRQLWSGRFRAADTPAAKRRVLERFRVECLGLTPARSA